MDTPIASFRNRADAEQAKRALSEAGIDATIREPHEAPPGWRRAPSELVFTIWVAREFDDKATRIVHKHAHAARIAERCDVCRETSATVHITTFISDASGKNDEQLKQERHLCAKCAKAAGGSPETVAWNEKILTQVCEWCGKPATGGGHGPDWERFYCTDCGQEWGQILRGVYENFPRPSDPKMVSDWATRAMREADGIMRKRLRRRR